MNPLIQWLSSAAAAAVLVALIGAVRDRRKLGAEATKIITDAAAGVVGEVRADNRRLRGENAALARRERELEDRVDGLEDERDEWRRVLRTHEAWDRAAVAAIRAAVPPVDLSDPPPLAPPSLRADRP